MNAETNQAIIERFYRAFQQRDGAAMTNFYHPQATFADPAFSLRGEQIGKMWRMLCARGADLRVEFANARADDSNGSVDWQAWYTFSASGRPVHNIIHARLRFADDLIIEHIDDFDFWRWSRQALGPAGLLLGWSPILKRKVRSQAALALERFAG
jgi:hypothetical protein